MIKRYNFGFGLFGPLEQAEEGEFCKAEDVLEILDLYQRLQGNFNCLHYAKEAHREENCRKSIEIERLEKRNQFLASQVEDLTKIEEKHKKLEKEIKFNRKLIRIYGLAIGFLIAK